MDIVLLDDDILVHMVWKLAAQEKGLRIECFSEVESFLRGLASISFEVPVYIDSDLGKGYKGEVLAKQVSEMGFKRIYLTTGYSKSSFPEFPWISGIVGKDPPFCF